jgi:hypothetical protein
LEKIPPLKKHYFTLFLLLAASVMLMSWGSNGHSKINNKAALSFNTEMVQFYDWVDALTSHASDADARKDWDPSEGPRHYIDIDLYEEFNTGGSIPQDIDSAIALHSYAFVYDAGVLPWATINAYDSLRECIRRLDWDKAVLFASDLGHYVADGHMPLHITQNYDGQFSGNSGIHSRYESTMISNNNSQITYEGDDISFITDVNQYVFDYLYHNYIYVDSVLAADTYAKSINSNVYSSEYKQALWQKTGIFTKMLFKNASNALAEMIYSAWVEAGKPSLSAHAFIFEPEEYDYQYLEPNAPNPFSSSTHITYTLPKDTDVCIRIYDTYGKMIDTVFSGYGPQGRHELEWHADGLPEGIYFLVLKAGPASETRKMLLTR